MFSLQYLIQTRPHRLLRAMAASHGLAFNTRQSKEQAAARLYADLQAGALRRSYRGLGPAEQGALRALQAAGGRLPAYQFRARFGDIPPYRPWAKVGPRQPWRNTDSAAEKLWFMGLIEQVKPSKGQPEQVILAREVLAYLAPLPQAQALSLKTPLPAARGRQNCLTDLSRWLGGLLYEDIRPIWGRWLPLGALRRINDSLLKAEDLSDCRSELHSNYLRVLHYLAEAAGLVCVQGGCLKPSPAAWDWFSLPPAEQWYQLWAACLADARAESPLWAVYRWPAMAAWTKLVPHLESLSPGQAYELKSLRAALAFYGEGEIGEGELDFLLSGPLCWLGFGALSSPEVFCLCADDYPPYEAGRLVNWRLEAGPWVAPKPWAEIMAWLGPEGQIGPAAIRRGLAAGLSLEAMAQQLVACLGGALSGEMMAQLRAWEREARAFTAGQVLLLTCTDAAQLAALRHDRRLRPHFVQMLSAYHAVIRAEALPALKRRGCEITCLPSLDRPQAPPAPGLSPRQLKLGAPEWVAPATAAYLHLAVRVYQGLRQWLDLPLHLPAALRMWLEKHLDQAPAEAEGVLNQVEQLLDGRFIPPCPEQAEKPAVIRAAIEGAYHKRGKLRLVYYSPAQGYPTQRELEPISPLTESGGAWYFEAWCYGAEAARSFRLDRVLAVL